MKTTLKDIARETGFSISTVSRVLSGSDKISEKTRTEVIKCAEKLNYPANRIMIPPTRNSLLHIALVTDFHEGEFYASFYHGFSQSVRDENIRLALLNTLNPKKELATLLAEVSQQYYDGIILFTPELEQQDYSKLLQKLPQNFPIVSNALIETPVISTVTFDGYSGGHLAAEHFNERGYRDVAIIKGPFNKAEVRYRYNGFRDFVTQQDGMELTWEYNGNFHFEAGVAAFHEFKGLSHKPRAIFSCNDLMAHGFVEAAKSDGYSIPGDVAIIGYDDLPICMHNNPALSSIRTDFEQLGRATLQALKTKIFNPDAPAGMLSLIPVTPVIRKSS